MKKLLVATIAFALALVLRADFTYSNNVFRAIGEGASGTETLNSVNGSWSTFSSSVGNVSWQDSSLAFDLNEGQSIAFTAGASPDTNTVVQVEVKGVLSLVFTNDFPLASDLSAANTQLSFLIGVNADATPVTTNYYAWAGTDWVCLTYPAGAEPSVTNETDFIVTFNYMTNNSHFVQFAVKRGETTYPLNGGTALPLASAAGNVAGIKCYGSGSLKSADGSVGLAVAALSDNVRYGTLADAVAAAGTSATTVTVVRATSEDASIPASSQITISDPGEKATGLITVGGTVNVAATEAQFDPATNGVYTIPLKTSGGTVVVDLPTSVAQYKEVASNKVVTATEIDVAIHTRSDIVRALNPGGDRALTADETKLREFLATYTNEAYAAAHATTNSLTPALQASGANGIPLWQSYVLGIAPTDSIAPVTAPAGDTDANNITLAIPAIVPANYSGDYDVSYQAVGPSGASNGASTSNPQSIKVPLATGSYSVNVELTPPKGN